jgi:D-aminopeptidase
MPVPWVALGRILRQAPVVLAAADALLARTRRPSTPAADLEALRQRISELEQHQQATATLAKELAEQAQAIAAALQADAAKTRQTFILSVVGIVLGVFALAIVLLFG